MKLLVTGGAGFIGSNFIHYMLEKHEDIQIINLDKLTYAGNLANIKELVNDSRHVFVKGDICDSVLLDNLFQEFKIEGVVHFAAESHVDNSIADPGAFMNTNVIGTFTLLEAARKYWMSDLNQNFGLKRFHHISTDEVYGTLGDSGYFTENSCYAPNSPYSASKASSDMIVRSYHHTFEMNVVTTNCSNNYGPGQHQEKLIPTIVRKALALEPIPIYGDGRNIRDWLYVLDHCRAIEAVFFGGRSGETYLIGGHNEKTNIDIAEEICGILDSLQPINHSNGIKSYKELIQFVTDRRGHDFRYAIDDSKLQNELGFKLKYDFNSGIERTVKHLIETLKNK